MTPKILFVEDERLVAMELESILLDSGCEPVGIAPDPTTVKEYLSEPIDVALVNLNLRDGPTGPTGPQIGKLLCDKDVTVLFLTATVGGCADYDFALTHGQRAIFGGVRRQFVDNQRKRGCAAVVDLEAVARNHDFRLSQRWIGCENLADDAVQALGQIVRPRFVAVGTDEFMRPAKHRDPLLEADRKTFVSQLLARR